MKLNIIADKNMPLVEEYFSDIGRVTFVDGRSVSKQQLKHADILLVRSVTSVNRNLLENTPVKFVGTATIGTDHIDQLYLQQNNIGFASAPGCNANSVAEYILSAILAANCMQPLITQQKQLAIVGLGNVGSRLAELSEILGLNYICYDPPKQNSKGVPHRHWCSWQQVLAADVISLHVPLTTTGPDATKYLFSTAEFHQLKQHALLINSSRGGVVDNDKLVECLTDKASMNVFEVILDVWENEPEINLSLRDLCIQHTPHIAGYSIDGKRKGTEMMYQAVVDYFDLRNQKPPRLNQTILVQSIQWSDSLDFVQNLKNFVFEAYDINQDSLSLKQLEPTNKAKSFDLLRQNYPDRLEFNHYLIEAVPRQYKSLIKALGFQLASPILDHCK